MEIWEGERVVERGKEAGLERWEGERWEEVKGGWRDWRERGGVERWEREREGGGKMGGREMGRREIGGVEEMGRREGDVERCEGY